LLLDLDEILIQHQVLNDTHLRVICQANGNPSPSFLWLSDGLILSNQPVVEIRRNESEKNYVCQVNNTVGTNSRALVNTNNYCKYIFWRRHKVVG